MTNAESGVRRVGLIVASDEVASLFSSVAAAEGYLEAIDVEDGVFPTAYDSEGRVYQVSQHGLSRWDSGTVRITATEQIAPDQMAALLRELAGSLRVGPDPNLPIEALLKQLGRYVIA